MYREYTRNGKLIRRHHNGGRMVGQDLQELNIIERPDPMDPDSDRWRIKAEVAYRLLEATIGEDQAMAWQKQAFPNKLDGLTWNEIWIKTRAHALDCQRAAVANDCDCNGANRSHCRICAPEAHEYDAERVGPEHYKIGADEFPY